MKPSIPYKLMFDIQLDEAEQDERKITVPDAGSSVWLGGAR